MSLYARWRAKRIWLRDPARAVALLDGGGGSVGDGEALAVRAWLALTYERDEALAERKARASLAAGGDTRLASSTRPASTSASAIVSSYHGTSGSFARAWRRWRTASRCAATP